MELRMADMKRILGSVVAGVVLLGGLALSAFAAEQEVIEGDVGSANKADLYAGRTSPSRPLFGDTHLHTGFSMDAGAFGARLGPPDAYRFARGDEISSNTGQPVKLSRPLDFLVVADHSDGMGFFPLLMSGDPTLMATEQGRRWHDQIKGGKGAEAALDIIMSFGLRHRMTNSPISRSGTRATWTAARRRPRTCCNSNTPAPPSRTASCLKASWAPIRTSSV